MTISPERRLNAMKAAATFRQLHNDREVDSRHIFSSNDYLGYAKNPQLLKSFSDRKTWHQFGATGARLLSGNHPTYRGLEDDLAALFNKPSALFFNSGYQANVGIVSALMGPKDLIVADKAIHASLIDGAKLSGATLRRYRHLDMAHAEQILEKERQNYENALLISESLFSMDGDMPAIKALVQLKTTYDMQLMLDEAHSFGLYGHRGAGLASQWQVLDDVDILVATFGKALGGYGAFMVGQRDLRDLCINSARAFIYSTALPVPLIYWNRQALTQMQIDDAGRRALQENIRIFRALAFDRKHSKTEQLSPIQTLILGQNQRAIAASQALRSQGFEVLPIRHPTVPKNKARLRLSISATHDPKVIAALARRCKRGFEDA